MWGVRGPTSTACFLQQPWAYEGTGLASRAVPECSEPDLLHQGCGFLGRVGPDQRGERGGLPSVCVWARTRSQEHSDARGATAQPTPLGSLLTVTSQSAQLGPPWAWATPGPHRSHEPLLTCQVAHGGPCRPRRRPLSSQPPGPSKSKVLKNVLPATQPPHPTSGAGTGPWLAYQARGSRLSPALAAPTKAHGALGPSSRVPPKGEQVPWWLQRPVRGLRRVISVLQLWLWCKNTGHGAAEGHAVPARGTEQPLCLADWTARPVCLPSSASKDLALCPQLGTCLACRRLAPSE